MSDWEARAIQSDWYWRNLAERAASRLDLDTFEIDETTRWWEYSDYTYRRNGREYPLPVVHYSTYPRAYVQQYAVVNSERRVFSAFVPMRGCRWVRHNFYGPWINHPAEHKCLHYARYLARYLRVLTSAIERGRITLPYKLNFKSRRRKEIEPLDCFLSRQHEDVVHPTSAKAAFQRIRDLIRDEIPLLRHAYVVPIDGDLYLVDLTWDQPAALRDLLDEMNAMEALCTG